MASENDFRYTLNFKINEQILAFDLEDESLYTQLMNDDMFAERYILQMAENNMLSVDLPVRSICRITESNKQILLYCADSDCANMQNPQELRNPKCNEESQEDGHWQHNETLCLIAAVEGRFEDMYHPKKKKSFWTVVSEELISNNINFDPKKCKEKWENLIRTYKNSKDKKNKSGRGPTRFLYFDSLDELLGDKPNNCSPHSVDVGAVSEVESIPGTSAINVDSASDNDGNIERLQDCKTPKRKNPTLEYVNVKKGYYESKGTMYKNYLDQKVAIYKEKLQLEKRKVAALEALVTENVKNNKN